MGVGNDNLGGLLDRIHEVMATSLDVPIQELVIYEKAKSEEVIVEFVEAGPMEDSVDLYEIKARATWPSGRTVDRSGVVSTEGLSGTALDSAVLRCARLAFCRTLDWHYPFEDEDLIPPDATLLSIDPETGDLYPKIPDSLAKKDTMRQIQNEEFGQMP